MKLNTLILWDSADSPPDRKGMLYQWNGYTETAVVRSLLRYVEEHGERLRSKYLAWIHEFGESRINGKRLIDHLAFEDGLSFWWMSPFTEKSFYHLPISDAIRLLALEEIVKLQRPGKIKLVTSKHWLHETISNLCRSLEIDYEEERLPLQPLPLNRRGIYQRLPLFLQALLSLARNVRVGCSFRRASIEGWFKGNQALFICGYFVNVVPEEAAAGHFYSRYWEGLHGLLQQMGIRINWLHHNADPTSDTALEWVQRFNRTQQNQAFHSFLNAYLSMVVAFRVFRRWLWLNLICRRLRDVEQAFHVSGTSLSLWPLMRRYWEASLRGKNAIDNLFSIELFDAALRDLPRQKKGLYLCENNAWERALIHAWRKHGHGQLVAVAHSTVRFWDLRYFTDARTLRSADLHQIPLPDLTALNGKVAMDAYLGADYLKEAIVEVEALRYGYLNNLQVGNTRIKKNGDTVKVLILGDLLISSTIKLLQLLEVSVLHMGAHFIFTIKPHPVCPVNPDDFSILKLTVVTDPLGKLLQDFDIAYCSNITSAAVDAYLAGLPVVVMLDDTELNFSPLRGLSGVRFVCRHEELAEALQKPPQGAAANPDLHNFFFLDPELSRWRRLLSSVGRW